jgi:hypothetical protein
MEWDFTTNGEIDADTYAKAPEKLRGAYEERDGKYVISETARGLVESITGLSGALKNERKVTGTLRGQKDATAVFQELFGDDVTDAETAKAKAKELRDAAAANAKVDPAKIKADIERTFATEREELNGKVGKMEGTLSKHLVDNAAVQALAAAKGSTTLLLPHIRNSVKVVADGDDYVVRVLDSQGDYRGDGKGGFMSVEDLVAELKNSKEFAPAFESDGMSGSETRTGVRPGETRRGPPGQTKRDDMSPTQMLQAGLEARRRR